MRFSVSILLMVVFSTTLFAQAPDTLWTKTYGDSNPDIGASVQQTTDGGYIVCGSTHSDIWLIKTDANGDTLWTRTFSDGLGIGKSVQQTTDNGYIIAGSLDNDIWLIKADESGDALWTKTFGGSDQDYANSVQQTSDGGYIICGVTYSFGVGVDDVWLIKTDANGDTEWTKTFGGVEPDQGHSVQQTTDGGYIVAGNTFSFGAGSSDIWLIKTDAYGDTMWTKTFGDSDGNSGFSVQQTTDGGYIIAGNEWLIKTSVYGDTLWTRTFKGFSHSVQQTTDSGYIITGATFQFNPPDLDVWLLKTDANGDSLWTKTLGGSFWDWGNSVQQTTDGGYVIVSQTQSFGAGRGDVWLIKIAQDVTAINGDSHISISDYHLEQNYPNPFNPTTTINYQLPTRGKVELSIYNLLGQRIRTLVNSDQPAGNYKVQWDGRDDAGKQVSSGIYFYRLKAGNDFSETKKMILMR